MVEISIDAAIYIKCPYMFVFVKTMSMSLQIIIIIYIEFFIFLLKKQRSNGGLTYFFGIYCNTCLFENLIKFPKLETCPKARDLSTLDRFHCTIRL